ncbi:hypothetical protein P43SY_001679 [Pythium insidiosum]|uniref:Mitochondrial import inner membrane translocase subunit Tim21 n=1 Tax=Pythium insidiosum TaxID=114742 RepID=A0AAD5Q6M5_PYTIN|nr:hypothetical protein P43SY_001679 [Pythium insidiosum]
MLVLVVCGLPCVLFLLSRKSPVRQFNESFDLLATHEEVTSRLGEPLHAFGLHLGRNVRRHQFDRYQFKDKDGCVHSRLKYNVMGPKGHANVYLEVVDGAPKHEYVYLIVEFTDLGEVVKIIDNRKEADSIDANSTAIIDGHEPE